MICKIFLYGVAVKIQAVQSEFDGFFQSGIYVPCSELISLHYLTIYGHIKVRISVYVIFWLTQSALLSSKCAGLMWADIVTNVVTHADETDDIQVWGFSAF